MSTGGGLFKAQPLKTAAASSPTWAGRKDKGVKPAMARAPK